VDGVIPGCPPMAGAQASCCEYGDTGDVGGIAVFSGIAMGPGPGGYPGCCGIITGWD